MADKPTAFSGYRASDAQAQDLPSLRYYLINELRKIATGILQNDQRLINFLTNPDTGRFTDYMHWTGLWTPGFYRFNDVVYDDQWTMICVNENGTADRPAPQPIGSATWSLPTTPAWATNSNSSTVESGQSYVVNSDGWFQGLRVWPPQVGANITYRIILIRDPNGTPEFAVIDNPTMLAGQWNIVSTAELIVPSGTELAVVLQAVNSGATTPVTGGWRFDGSSQNAAPGTGGWNRNNQTNVLRIDKTDLDSVDRSTELLGMVPGTTIQFAETTTPANFETYLVLDPPVDSGSDVVYGVQLSGAGGTIPTGVATTMDAEVPIPQPTQYVQLAGNWPTGNPTWATSVTGFLEFDGVAQPGVANDAFGVDLLFQPGEVSDDWQIVAHSA